MVAFGPFEDFELDLWRQVQAVNVESALLLTQAFAPGMRERGFGRVVFIVSNTSWRPPGAHMLAYVASKGALIGMTHALAVGLGGYGIAVTAVAPGLTRTPATGVVPVEEFEELRLDDSARGVAAVGRGGAVGERGGRQIDLPVHP